MKYEKKDYYEACMVSTFYFLYIWHRVPRVMPEWAFRLERQGLTGSPGWADGPVRRSATCS